MKKNDNLWELIKFLITGVICAVADFLTTALFLMIFQFLAENLAWLQSAIALLAGFIVGVILNYILSTFWVFKGKQDKDVTKSKRFIILFVDSKYFIISIDWPGQYGLTNSGNIVPIFNPTCGLKVLSIN